MAADKRLIEIVLPGAAIKYWIGVVQVYRLSELAVCTDSKKLPHNFLSVAAFYIPGSGINFISLLDEIYARRAPYPYRAFGYARSEYSSRCLL